MSSVKCLVCVNQPTLNDTSKQEISRLKIDSWLKLEYGFEFDSFQDKSLSGTTRITCSPFVLLSGYDHLSFFYFPSLLSWQLAGLWTTLVTPSRTALVREFLSNAFQRAHAWGCEGHLYTKTVDTVEGALWLATHIPNILFYQPSNGIYERKYFNRCRNKRVKIIFCVLYYLTAFEYTKAPLFFQCRRLFVDIKYPPPSPWIVVNYYFIVSRSNITLFWRGIWPTLFFLWATRTKRLNWCI